MPLFSSKLELTSAASGSGTALADVDFIRGAFRTLADTGAMNGIPVSQVSDGQIVWIESESATYQATVTPADFINTFEDTVSWAVFSGFGSGGGATNLGDLADVVTSSLDDGDVLAWNNSNSRWEPTNVSGTGDIGGVIAGDGLSGGGTQGTVSLDVDPGLAIELTSAGVQLDTGSNHFINAINSIASSGIFRATGSKFNTTGDLEISGSLTFQYDGSTVPLSIDSGSLEVFSVSGEGIIQIISQSNTPNVVEGGIYRGNDNNFYLGI